jgi:hypothetical protein
MLKKYFSTIKLLGIQATEKVMSREKARIKQNRLINYMDPLNLRNIVPESIKPIIIQFLRSILNIKRIRGKYDNFVNKYSLQNYYIVDKDIEFSLDLFGICKK